jgi:hypothetical protein
MTRTRPSGCESRVTISRFENSDSVRMTRARRALHAVTTRRRSPSRAANHSGCATNDTSWMARAMGQGAVSGAV